MACDAIRYTPAGIPIVEAVLSHQSQVSEAGQVRWVECEVTILAAGDLALQLSRISLNIELHTQGFLARKRRNSKALVYHLSHLSVT